MIPSRRSLATSLPAAVHAVRRVVLTDFRNYPALALAVEAAPVVLFGPNGAGKTNLLEALSFLSPGRGLRRARLAEVDRVQAGAPCGPWAVAASVAGPAGLVEIGTGRAAGADRRLVRVDGLPQKSATVLAEWAQVGWLTPQMDRLFLEGAGVRRRFLDRLAFGFEPGHAETLAAYDRALRQRALLLQGRSLDTAWLGALEHAMAEHGIAVATARRRTARRLDARLARGRDAFPAARVAVAGEVEGWLEATGEAEVRERFAARLAGNRACDAATGGAVLGPPRSDLAVRHAARDLPAAQASTGEQKALLLAITLAHAELLAEARGVAPILLLDEVAAHLDAENRACLFAEVRRLGIQAWMSGTDRALFAAIAGTAQMVAVDRANLTPC
ncbi:MAG: DNA replication/repair protein RecF [Alphaproteobacteria bacterium]|nr:DNA replication/repair protein RecF [Alphaproteobacteria bacterium]